MKARRVDSRLRSASARLLLVLASAALMILAPAARAQEAGRSGQQLPLARYFPSQDLVVYVEFDGLDPHREAWKKTALYRVLNETTTGAMYKALLPRVLDLIIPEASGVSIAGKELSDLALHLARSGFAVGINRADGKGPPRCFGLVIRGGAKTRIRETVDRLLHVGASPRLGGRDIPKAGRTIHQYGGAAGAGTVSWWPEGEDLVVSLVAPEGPNMIIDALEGRVPNATAHPIRDALSRNEDIRGFEPVGLAYFDMAALPPLPPEAISLGLDRIKRFTYRWGFHDDAILSVLGAAVPSPRTGIPAMFSQGDVNWRRLPPLPAGLAGFTVLSLDESRLWPALRASLAAIAKLPGQDDLGGENQLDELIRASMGVSLHDEIFAHLGTRFTFYDVAGQIKSPSHILESFAQGLFRAPKMAVVAEVKNRSAIEASLEKMVSHLNATLRDVSQRPPGLTIGAIERLKNGESGYVMSFVGSEIPISSGLRPTLLLGRKTLVLASTPAMARRARDLAETQAQAGPGVGNPPGARLDWLPDKLTMLSVADTANSVYPELLVGMPAFAESVLKSRRFRFFPFLMAGRESDQAAVELMPALPASPPRAAASDPLPPFDAELVPDPDDLRPYLFPSVQALAVDDIGIRFISREAIPTLNPSTAVPIALAALVPAVRRAQLTSDRAHASANLKRIGEAFLIFHDIHTHFPADIRNKAGKPVLSWRVAVLPFLDQGELFKEFHLDEPWDSPHNKALVARMPAVYAIPGEKLDTPGNTFYRGFAGAGAIFDPKEPDGVSIADVVDGISNTMLVAEAKESVAWTKPQSDIPFDDDQKPERTKALLDALGGHSRGGFNGVFCDGAIRFIRSTVAVPIFRAIITYAGGEVVASDSF